MKFTVVGWPSRPTQSGVQSVKAANQLHTGQAREAPILHAKGGRR